MEFTKRHNDRQTVNTKSPTHATRISRPVNTSPPTVKDAFKASFRILKVALSHATKATLREAKELYKLTEEGFDLDENPRWQKFRAKVQLVARKLRLPKLPRKVYVAIGCILVVGLVSTVIYRTVSTPTGKKEPKSFTSNKLEKGTPTYDTLLPEGKTIDSLGGWTRVSPGTSNPVYAFGDKVEGIPVIVSEQPLPETLSSLKELEEFAKAYSASHKVTVENVTVYIGTSAKGPQSAVLAKNNLLILIKTDSKLTDAQWANYVGSLK